MWRRRPLRAQLIFRDTPLTSSVRSSYLVIQEGRFPASSAFRLALSAFLQYTLSSLVADRSQADHTGALLWAVLALAYLPVGLTAWQHSESCMESSVKVHTTAAASRTPPIHFPRTSSVLRNFVIQSMTVPREGTVLECLRPIIY